VGAVAEPPQIVRLAFLGAFQAYRGGSWNDVVAERTPHVLPALGRRQAVRLLRAEAERAGSRTLDLRFAGYSWGAWTSVQLAALLVRDPRRVHPFFADGDWSLALGLLDPVGTLRWRTGLPEDPRVVAWNVFQTNGCYRTCPGASDWYAGRPVPGARENLDVTLEGRERPMCDGVPPERAPDHIQMGYRGWNGHDAYVASVLERGRDGPVRA
jgi:hypothetical protein